MKYGDPCKFGIIFLNSRPNHFRFFYLVHSYHSIRVKMKTTRRNFLKTSGAALASTALFSGLSPDLLAFSPLAKPDSFGFQIWTVRDDLLSDFAGTLKKMANIGYTQVEMCSPLGYGFKSLNEMSGTEMRKIIEDAGLKCISSHFTSGELKDSLDNRIEWASQIGMKQMIQSMPGLNPRTATMDEWRKAAQALNVIAEKTKAAGIQMGYHNHNFEVQKIDGELIYTVLMDELDPDLVKMQFQVAVIDEGFKAQDFFRKYPGRFISAHLADYSTELGKQVPLGQGVVDWEDLFRAAKETGIKNYFVEMAPDTFEESAKFLLS
jgi:sugar phosphate isomerase/epimerase